MAAHIIRSCIVASHAKTKQGLCGATRLNPHLWVNHRLTAVGMRQKKPRIASAFRGNYCDSTNTVLYKILQIPTSSALVDHCTCQVLPSVWSKRMKLNLFWVGYRVNLPGLDVDSFSTKETSLNVYVKALAVLSVLYWTMRIFPVCVSRLMKFHRFSVGKSW